jgi:Zn-dependent M28 family amino/carboxypeptidase
MTATRSLAWYGVACGLLTAFSSACSEPRPTALQPLPLPTAPVSSAPPVAPPEQKELPPLHPEALMRHVRALADPALEGRAAGSAGERRAADYIRTELARSGLVATPQEVVLTPQERSLNLHTTVGGKRDQVVVVGAHFDHLGRRDGAIYPGAEDNASGVALLLELVRALGPRRGELERSILVVFFGAEEIGLVGSRAFVAQPPVLVAHMDVMVNIDMIGRRLADQALLGPLKRAFGIDDERTVGVLGARRYPELRKAVDRACQAAGMRAIAPEDLPPAIGKALDAYSQGRGDSDSFERVGIPALFFGAGESSDYHQPSDTPDTISGDILALRGRMVLELVVALSQADKAIFTSGP